MIGGVMGLLAELWPTRPRVGALATEALGRVAMAVWALTAAGLVLAQAVRAGKRSSAALAA